MTQVLRELILPPGAIVMLAALAWALRHKAPRISGGLALGATLLLYLLSLWPVGFALAQWTYREPVLTEQALRDFQPQALVVLGGGSDITSPEYPGLPTPNQATLQRVRYAAHLAKKTKLPILVAGGFGALPEQSEAAAMRLNLHEYGLTPRWLETKSQNTSENASRARAVLADDSIVRIVLVTSSHHARRARLSFKRVGFRVLSAPTAFELPQPEMPFYLNVVPNSDAFDLSADSLEALLGELWYRLSGW